MIINIDQFSNDLADARSEITLEDLTQDQWNRVCNRIANCLNKQWPFHWEKFVDRATGTKPSEREVA